MMIKINRKKLWDICGVYKIECIPTGKKYIGGSVNIGNRWLVHLSTLRLGKNGCTRLQQAWDEYEEDNFKFEIIELVEYKKFLSVLEQSWIEYFKTYNPEYGFNTYSKDGLSLDYVHGPRSFEQIEKHADSISRDWIVTSPAGVQYKIKNLNRFCKENGLDQANMHKIAKGKAKQHKGWRCEYVQ